jgi:hypothetical protein
VTDAIGYLLRNLAARARLLRVEWVARSDSNSKGSGKNAVLSAAMYGENISGWSGRHSDQLVREQMEYANAVGDAGMRFETDCI